MTPTQTVMTALNIAPAKKTPEALLEDALSTFTKAEQKLEAAVAEVANQTAVLEKQRATLEAKIENASSVMQRLQRIRQRVADLLA